MTSGGGWNGFSRSNTSDRKSAGDACGVDCSLGRDSATADVEDGSVEVEAEY